MSTEISGKEVREYRVWRETSDFIGGATIYLDADGSHYVTPNPYRTDDSSANVWFTNDRGAFAYARGLCERYMTQVVEDETKDRGEVPTGVLSEHGYSIQVCENGTDITGHDW